MDFDEITRKELIAQGECCLGIEFGSTRIKAVLMTPDFACVAVGVYDWENRFEDGFFTYHLDEIWMGLRACYRNLADSVLHTYEIPLRKIAGLGISAMMHGYLVFDKEEELLTPFRTWRNTNTAQASQALTDAFSFHIPQRFSIAHLYQAMLNQEEHVGKISFLTTLAGYIHWKITGQKVLGICDASGMFPIDSATNDYQKTMMNTFEQLARGQGFDCDLSQLLPKVVLAGENAGYLTKEGAALLDETGLLEYGCPLCGPEGDAATGMVATNSVAARTGNLSAGTSIFSMVVLEKPFHGVYPEIDLVTTPSGKPVAMVHCNNCTSDINAWAGLFSEVLSTFGMSVDKNILFTTLYGIASEADADCGGLLSYNYLSGEPITGFLTGRPVFTRAEGSHFTLPNFMRTHLFSALATLRIGMDILYEKENVRIDSMTGQGGFFKTEPIGAETVAAALATPVTLLGNVGEGGAWGACLLASYLLYHQPDETLDSYLNDHVFANISKQTTAPDQEKSAGFDSFLLRYQNGLAIEEAAINHL